MLEREENPQIKKNPPVEIPPTENPGKNNPIKDPAKDPNEKLPTSPTVRC